MDDLNGPLDSNNGPQQTLPNSAGILVLGILSIILSGIIGVILGIIALNLAKKAKFDYDRNPTMYTPGSYSTANAGKICAIIGISISVLAFIIIIAVVAGR
jgi:uncharacterized membrane protein YjgN (DUF898 family)